MAIGTATPRDQLDKLIAYVRRAIRYWWLVAVITMGGGALAVTFAFLSKPKYVSEARIIYNERISSSLLQGRDVVNVTNNLGNRYHELLMARPQLGKVITELGILKKTVASEGLDAAINEFKEKVEFRIRGTGMFHIQYTAPDPEQAQAVTTMLTDILISEDRRLRQENAKTTKEFLVKEKADRSTELNKRLSEFNKFLAEHPEFALASAQGTQGATGAGIRAVAEGKTSEAVIDPKNTDPRLEALLRQRKRIKASLEAPDDGSARTQKTAEQIEAERAVREAKDELDKAERDLEQKLAQFQQAHPDVRRAEKRVADAKDRVKRAEAAVPPALPKGPKIDRNVLAQQLQDIDKQISAARTRVRNEQRGDQPDEEEKPAVDDTENWIVSLENDFSRLTLAVEEARSRVREVDANLSKAEITASQQMAEEGAVLSVIDPANLPTKPEGKGRIFLTGAGIMAFFMMGSVLALALALVDDRLYTAGDLEQLGIAPVLVVIPKAIKQKKRSRRG